MEGEPSETGYCVFECRAEESNSGDENQGSSSHELQVLDLAFFDNDTLLMVTRTIEPGLDETELGELFTFVIYVWVCVVRQPFIRFRRPAGSSSKAQFGIRGPELQGHIVISGIFER